MNQKMESHNIHQGKIKMNTELPSNTIISKQPAKSQ